MTLSDLQDAKEQIRQSIDIVDLVGGYLSLRRQGRNYVGLCPWHDDSKPSLTVNPQRQSFKCWPCEIGGDIFTFVMKMESLDFREALEMLADRAGVQLAPPRKQADGSDYQFDRRNLYKAVAWAEDKFHQCLLTSPEAEPARQYLADREISSESIEKFHIGFAPHQWDWLLGLAQQVGASPAVLERVGLVGKRQQGEGYYDRFRGRLMFSIRDPRSRPIAFGGRVLPGLGDENPDRPEAKYINSPETPLFSKSAELYALDLAKDGIDSNSGIVVMEGYTDVIMAHQHGIANAVAVLGTALGERHVPLVRRFTDRITLVLDGDDAGQNRTMQILDELLALFVKQDVDLQILTLPTGSDPCDVIASQGREAFTKLLSTAVDALDHKIAAVTNGLASQQNGKGPSTHAAAQAVEEILGTVARAFPTGGNASSVSLVREQQVLSKISRRFGITDETIRTRLTAKRREQSSRRRSYFADQHSPSEAPAQRRDERLSLSAWEKELLELLLHQPQVLPEISKQLRAEDIRSTFCRQMYTRALELTVSGQTPSFQSLIAATDDNDEKNLLVACDELGEQKSASDTGQRVRDLLSLAEQQKQEAWQNSQVAELKQNQLDPEHEQEVLAELFDAFKQKHQ
ncbi:MAG: DNA primase [Planctomycetota bacterium]